MFNKKGLKVGKYIFKVEWSGKVYFGVKKIVIKVMLDFIIVK